MSNKKIILNTKVHAPIEKVWAFWTNPEHIVNWNFASDDWHCPHAVNNLEVAGKFSYTMAAKDGRASFDFEGTYDTIAVHEHIVYTIADGRQVEILFVSKEGDTLITETFEPETMNPEAVQRQGWQAILDNFKSYVENS